MSDTQILIILAGSYLLGGIPFGYLLGRIYGVDLFSMGSGNIGATNAGRVLGWRIGATCFVLDFLKGAGPVAIAGGWGASDSVRVAAAALAFVGHLFPIYLGFRGGKGVATGAGTLVVLVPFPTAVAATAWLLVVLASRYVSLASLAAVAALILTRLISTPSPFASDSIMVTGYCLLGGLMVAIKHRSNIHRLWHGSEGRLEDRPMGRTIVNGLHLLAVGLWFGGAAFFNFGTAVPIFESFKQVVAEAPSDRTAQVAIVPEGTSDETKAALANALAGAAVGPVFPNYFGMQAICGVVALVTALRWWNAQPDGRLHRLRVAVVGLGLLLVAVGWPISEYVSELRPLRFAADPAIAASAKAAFGSWHLVSLLLSLVTVLFAGIALFLGAKLPPAGVAVSRVEPSQPAAAA